MKIMAFATALTLALGALTLPLSESGYSFADKAAVSAQAGTNDFKYDSADIFTADSLLDRAILPDGERIFDHDPILAYTPTTRDWLFKQTAEEVVDNSWLISADTLWLNAEKAFNFEFVGEDSVFTRQQFVYETIIMDYLTYQYQSDEFKSDIEKSTTKFMYKIEKKVLDNEILSDEAFDNKIKGMSKEDAADFAKEQHYLKRFNEVNVSAYDALIDGAETAKDYFKKLSKLMALQEASTTRLDFLQKIKDNTDDKALIKAIDDITAKYNDELSNVVWNEFLQTGMETFNGVVWDSIKDFFKKKFKIEIPGFSSIKLGMAGIDWAFNEKGMAESRIQLTILYIIHADVMQTYIDMRDSYINNGTEESAQEFVNAYSQYLAFIAYSSGITKEYLGETLIDGAYNSIKNLFSSTNQTAYNDYCSALNSEISICQTLDKYVGLAKDFYNKMSGYNASEDTKVPESAAIGTRFTSGYLTYEVTGKGKVKVARCDDSAVSVNIPKIVSYDGYDYYVTKIGEAAFEYCPRLVNITIHDSITSIVRWAFRGCSILTSITIDQKNKYFSSENGVLFNNDKSELVAYPAGNSSKEYTIPDSVKSIDDFAFNECLNLTSITLPESIISIGDWAFIDCTSLKNITIPNSVTSIGSYVFEGCTSLTNITIPNSVTSIGNGAFYNCTSLSSITIPSSVTSIGGSAFRYCSSLANITIPNSVTSIKEFVFENCTSLSSITIPSSVTSIDESAFLNCENLRNIIVDSGNKYFSSENGVLFNKNKSTLLIYPEGKSQKEYTIPYGVTIIDYGAFYRCTKLTSIIIPNSVTSIRNSVFMECTNLTSITIPNSVTSIDESAFYNCFSLADVYYTGSADDWTKLEIGDYNDGLTNATIHYNYDPNHTHSYTSSITKQPTCTAEGIRTFKCNCGDTYTETIPAKGHTSSKWIIDKQPAVGVKGSKHKECTVCGKVLETAEIPALTSTDISGASVKLSATSYTYNGKAKKPTATVTLNGKTLKKNVDYTVKYSSNTAIGKAKVTISGKGNYKGTVSKTFKILPAKQTIAKFTAQKKGFAVKWTKDTNVTGYQIQYDVKSDLKSAKSTYVKTNTTYKKTISGLKSKKTYYVRVRSYKTVGGVKYYGSWSAVKSVKTK